MPDDICVWPDDTACWGDELEEFLTWKSDDYIRYSVGDPAYLDVLEEYML